MIRLSTWPDGDQPDKDLPVSADRDDSDEQSDSLAAALNLLHRQQSQYVQCYRRFRTVGYNQ
jgi:hypothetical protein